ncbi:aspartic peptidase domain-containing protein [Chytriomyces sp. MP71]|nr:aspartic peptidase domain-containing protein [Chytriomyces sp. MP71]
MTFSYLIVRLAEIASLQSSTNRSATLSGFKAPLRRGSDKVSLGESFHRYSAAFASGTAAAPITNGGLANYFYVDLRVGSHTTIPQSVCFDTGSADTWVVGSTCTTDAGHACRRGQKTAVAVDVSFTNTSVHAQTAYGDGTYGVNYTVYYADVTFGGVTATQMPVGVATYLYGGMSGTGILGMGWNSISGISSKLRGSNANFLDTAGFTSFGMYINPSTLVEGEVSFGFYDASMYTGEFQWFPVTYKGWWQFDGHALVGSCNLVLICLTRLLVADVFLRCNTLLQLRSTRRNNQIQSEYCGFWNPGTYTHHRRCNPHQFLVQPKLRPHIKHDSVPWSSTTAFIHFPRR